MAEGVGQASQVQPVPGWAASVLAGAGAGVVAALASVAAEIMMRAQLPPRVATLWSAFVVAGILYGWLGRTVRRPVVALCDPAVCLRAKSVNRDSRRGAHCAGAATAGSRGDRTLRHPPLSVTIYPCGCDDTLHYRRGGVAARAVVGEAQEPVIRRNDRERLKDGLRHAALEGSRPEKRPTLHGWEIKTWNRESRRGGLRLQPRPDRLELQAFTLDKMLDLPDQPHITSRDTGTFVFIAGAAVRSGWCPPGGMRPVRVVQEHSTRHI